jgi:hypothetical protein
MLVVVAAQRVPLSTAPCKLSIVLFNNQEPQPQELQQLIFCDPDGHATGIICSVIAGLSYTVLTCGAPDLRQTIAATQPPDPVSQQPQRPSWLQMPHAAASAAPRHGTGWRAVLR